MRTCKVGFTWQCGFQRLVYPLKSVLMIFREALMCNRLKVKLLREAELGHLVLNTSPCPSHCTLQGSKDYWATATFELYRMDTRPLEWLMEREGASTDWPSLPSDSVSPEKGKDCRGRGYCHFDPGGGKSIYHPWKQCKTACLPSCFWPPSLPDPCLLLIAHPQ